MDLKAVKYQRVQEIMRALEPGTLMFKFRKKKQPEKRVFALRLSTFEIMQYPYPSRGRSVAEEIGKP